MKVSNLLEKPIWQMTGEEFLVLLQESPTSDQESNIDSRSNYHEDPKYVYGIRGIANLLNCSISTANRIKQRGVIDQAIIQQGRTIIVDAEKALDLLRKDSEK